MTTAVAGVDPGTGSTGDQRDRDHLDHRPVLGAGDHAVDGQDHRLARLAVLDQGLEAEHAGQRVGVGIDVRDDDGARKPPERGDQPLGPGKTQEQRLRVRLGRHGLGDLQPAGDPTECADVCGFVQPIRRVGP